jgi:restriction system protein
MSSVHYQQWHQYQRQQYHPAYYQPVQQGMSAALLEEATGPKLSILLQAVITRGEKTAEGDLIVAVAPAWFEIVRLLESDPQILFKIHWRKLEELIAGAYEQAGFDEVILTSRSGDHGRDIIAVKKCLGSVRLIDSVKAYAPHRNVEYDDVRALMGVLQSDGAAKGFLTTTSDFSPHLAKDPLILPFIPSRLELINGTMLREGLIALKNK